MTDPRGWPRAKLDGPPPPPELKWILWAAVLLQWEFTSTVINRPKFGRIPSPSTSCSACHARWRQTYTCNRHRCAVHLGALSASRLSHKSQWYGLCPCYIWQLLLISSIFFFPLWRLPPSAVCLSLLHHSEAYYGGAWWFLCIRLHWSFNRPCLGLCPPPVPPP